MITVRITTLSRSSSLLLVSLSLLMTYTLYMSHLQLNQLSLYNDTFSRMKNLATVNLSQSISSYLAASNISDLQLAKDSITQLQSAHANLPTEINNREFSQQLAEFAHLLQNELRSAGKLASDPQQLIRFNEQELIGNITTVKNIFTAEDQNSSQSHWLLLLNIQESLSQLFTLRQRYFNQLKPQQWQLLTDTVEATKLELLQLQQLAIFQEVTLIGTESGNFLTEDEDEQDVPADIMNEIVSLIKRYPKELENTKSILTQQHDNRVLVNNKVNQLQQTIFAMEKPVNHYAFHQRENTYLQLSLLSMSLVIFSILLFYTQKFWIVKPLSVLDNALSSLVETNTRQRLSFANNNNEIGIIALHFNQLLDNVKQEQLTKETHAAEISQSLDALKADFQSIISYSTASNLAITDINVSVTAIDKLAQQVDQQTRSVHEITNKTNQQMQHAAQQIESLNLATQATKQAGHNSLAAIQTLNSNMDSVEGIVTSIHHIADQTNLLALNAAIEAARAGEKGRGFAVVADEVRNLSKKTQHALEQISAFLNQLNLSSQSLEHDINDINLRCQLQSDSSSDVKSHIQSVISQSAQAQQSAAATSQNTLQQVEFIKTVNAQVASLQNHSKEAQQKTDFTQQQVSQQVNQILNVFA